MALEGIQTTVNKMAFNFFGTETERKIGGFLFDDRKEWASSREIHGLAALTFNEEQCFGVMAIVAKALEPADYTWKTLHKAVKLLHHFVVYGAERCVDHAWQLQRQVQALKTYNSAIHGRTAALNGGGTDFGAPVRKEAQELDDLLEDSDAIRAARAQGRAPDSLIPVGNSDDYVAPAKPQAIDLGKDDVFGVVQTGSIGAKFDLEHVPGMYEGRPDRYFDDSDDPRRRNQHVEDSDHTRQALAADLLDLDIGETQLNSVPDTQDLVRANKAAALQKQLQEQQQQLEQLKLLMLGRANQGIASGAVAVPAGANPMAHVGSVGAVNAGDASGANKVVQAFGSMGMDAAKSNSTWPVGGVGASRGTAEVGQVTPGSMQGIGGSSGNVGMQQLGLPQGVEQQGRWQGASLGTSMENYTSSGNGLGGPTGAWTMQASGTGGSSFGPGQNNLFQIQGLTKGAGTGQGASLHQNQGSTGSSFI